MPTGRFAGRGGAGWWAVAAGIGYVLAGCYAQPNTAPPGWMDPGLVDARADVAGRDGPAAGSDGPGGGSVDRPAADTASPSADTAGPSADTASPSADTASPGVDACQGAACAPCVTGGACPQANPCKRGAIACIGGSPQCVEAGNATDGTGCGGSRLCVNGICRDCDPSGPPTCRNGQRITCTSDGVEMADSCGGNGCTGNRCNACRPDSTICAAERVRRCGADGILGPAEECPGNHRCSGSACSVTECKSGFRNCGETCVGPDDCCPRSVEACRQRIASQAGTCRVADAPRVIDGCPGDVGCRYELCSWTVPKAACASPGIWTEGDPNDPSASCFVRKNPNVTGCLTQVTNLIGGNVCVD